ncbi:mRNA splicing protein prp18 [Entomortierella beljakovae]|nr:mRNA splicing protein prp18 [Entomortierella beljakovae]
MDLIEASIAKKRAAVESVTGTTKKKYVRRGDLEKQREQKYYEEQERERKMKEEAQRILDLEKEESRKSNSISSSPAPGTPSSISSPFPSSDLAGSDSPLPVSEDAASSATFNIPPEEVVRRLRARGQPIRLFAETDQQRKIRLRALELVEDRSEGQRNDFMKALENAETGLHMEALSKEKKTKTDTKKELDTSEISVDLIQKDTDKLYVLIYTYLKRLLREWERDLDERPDEIKRSTAGKLATATRAQSAEYLRPFFKLLRQKALEPDVLMRITEIAELMTKREHMAASDAYLKLSIGNAPWPIGVTMVGIHERSGREKIFSAQVAHVLNDETSRKWIQSIKRLMTFAEKKYPRLN